MKSINGKKIAEEIRVFLKKEVKRLKLKPKLVVFSVLPDPEGTSFIKMKQRAALELGGEFELITYKKTPKFENFVNNLQKIAHNNTTTGIVIQKPLPPTLSTSTLFDYVPTEKEIEGHKIKSPFHPPIGLAVLTVIKHIFSTQDKRKVENVIVSESDFKLFFKQILKRRKIVVIGRGETGGKPVGTVLTQAKINFININSKTPQPEKFIKEADLIVTAVGRKVITAETLKKGVILMNIGIRREKDAWKGDYDEEEIKDIASFYTPTPGGVGPLDIAYLMYNLVEATKLQQLKSR